MKRNNVFARVVVGSAIYLAGRYAVRRLRHYDLAGRLVLITGGSRGFGLLLAREYLRAGARVALCARDGEELQRAQKLLADEGTGNVWTGVCDVTDAVSVRRCVDQLTDAGGPVDVLINNAGAISVGPLDNMTERDFRQAMDVNFWGAFHAANAVLSGMRRQGGGRIVNICSVGGKISVPHMLPYSAGKFAMAGWSTGLRTELRRDGIYVTTVYPGLIRTGSPRNVPFKGQHWKEYAWFAIADALPLTSMNAARAARRTLQACINGEAELVLSWQAKLATTVAALAPGVTSELMSAVQWMLPRAVEDGNESRRGYQSESMFAPSMLTSLSDRAAAENNEGT